jgi:hypothetical protein
LGLFPLSLFFFLTVWFHLYDILFFPIFIRIYSLYGGDSLWQFQITLHYTLVRIPPPSPPEAPSLPCLKQLQDISSFFFIYYMKFINHIPSSSSCPFTVPTPSTASQTHTHRVPVLQFCCFSLFVFLNRTE